MRISRVCCFIVPLENKIEAFSWMTTSCKGHKDVKVDKLILAFMRCGLPQKYLCTSKYQNKTGTQSHILWENKILIIITNKTQNGTQKLNVRYSGMHGLLWRLHNPVMQIFQTCKTWYLFQVKIFVHFCMCLLCTIKFASKLLLWIHLIELKLT